MLTGTLSPVSNRATWSESVAIDDEETGEAIDLSDVDEITIAIRTQGSSTPVLSATLTGEQITIIETGVFQFEFSESQMGGLCPQTYEIGCTLEKDDQSVQLLIGTVSVLDGIVR